MELVREAAHLLQGGFSMNKIDEAKQLLAGAGSFWKSLHHKEEAPAGENGLGEEHFVENWKEGKDVWMFAGCR